MEWRDELCDSGKLMPYCVSGRQYLFIGSFHEHEHPRNPQRPNLPLPGWITWVPHETKPYKGHYEVRPVAPARAKKQLPAARKSQSTTVATRKNGNDGGSFDDFWDAYPRHEAKLKAEFAFERLNKGERAVAIAVARVMRQLVDSGQQELRYVPHPTTFINGKRWEDWAEGIPAGWTDASADRARQQQASIDAAILGLGEEA